MKRQEKIGGHQSRSWKDVDLLQYYGTHYPGMTPKELRRADPSFHQTLFNARLLSKIFQTVPWGDDPLLYYNIVYPGMTQSQLVVKDWALCLALRKNKVWSQIPKR